MIQNFFFRRNLNIFHYIEDFNLFQIDNIVLFFIYF